MPGPYVSSPGTLTESIGNSLLFIMAVDSGGSGITLYKMKAADYCVFQP